MQKNRMTFHWSAVFCSFWWSMFIIILFSFQVICRYVIIIISSFWINTMLGQINLAIYNTIMKINRWRSVWGRNILTHGYRLIGMVLMKRSDNGKNSIYSLWRCKLYCKYKFLLCLVEAQNEKQMFFKSSLAFRAWRKLR